jgi:uncharacterized protein (DUF1810 family)
MTSWWSSPQATRTECAEAVLALEGRSASDIFGYPDDLKFRSSLTLFAVVAEEGSVFEAGDHGTDGVLSCVQNASRK